MSLAHPWKLERNASGVTLYTLQSIRPQRVTNAPHHMQSLLHRTSEKVESSNDGTTSEGGKPLPSHLDSQGGQGRYRSAGSLRRVDVVRELHGKVLDEIVLERPMHNRKLHKRPFKSIRSRKRMGELGTDVMHQDPHEESGAELNWMDSSSDVTSASAATPKNIEMEGAWNQPVTSVHLLRRSRRTEMEGAGSHSCHQSRVCDARETC